MMPKSYVEAVNAAWYDRPTTNHLNGNWSSCDQDKSASQHASSRRRQRTNVPESQHGSTNKTAQSICPGPLLSLANHLIPERRPTRLRLLLRVPHRAALLVLLRQVADVHPEDLVALRIEQPFTRSREVLRDLLR